MKHSLSHYFIPQQKNNYRAALLRTNTILLLIAFYLLNHSFVKLIAFLKPGVLGYSSEITVDKVLNQTNQQRRNNGLIALKYNSTLSESATKKAQDMFNSNYWSHNSPSGKIPWDFFKEVGYQYTVAGENLARDFYDTNSLIKAWMNSPTHRANITNDKYQEIGIGVVNGILGGIKTTLVVQHFATPVSAIANKVETKTSATNINPNIQTQPVLIPLSEENEIILYSPDLSLSQNPEVLSERNIYINPLLINKVVGVIFFVLIISVLFVDGFITIKNNTRRLTGSTIGHIGFLLVILILILTNQQGIIF